MVRRIGALAVLLICMLAVLSACDSGPVARPPTPVPQWRFPTPFPPMELPSSEAPPPDLPAAIRPRTPAGTPAQPAAPGVSHVPTAPVHGQAQQELLQIEKDTSKLRGLDPKIDVTERFVTSDGMRAEIVAQRDKSYTREQARLAELELWLLRYVDDPGIDLFQIQADMLAEQVDGLYVPEEKTLYVLSSGKQLDYQARETVAHEFVHSLQDEYFDLQKVLPRTSTDGDRLLAARSIVEGDATFSGVLYADEYMTREDFAKLIGPQTAPKIPAGTPDIFEQELMFPYTKGVEFAAALYKRGGFKAINDALANPPRSTEQIMHPEKFMAAHKDEPIAVGLPPLTGTLASGWEYRESSTIGEFELQALLQGKNVASAESGAAGWGGGQYDLYTNGTSSLVFMGTIWDTLTDAQQFESGLRQSLVRTPNFQNLWTDGARYYTLKRVKNRVFYIGGTDRTAVQSALQVVK